jgi:Fe-S-cluster-containing dehydrogenase component/CRP-like cAMP-binding protein
MTDADVAWLRTRGPFNAMNRSSFPHATPLDGILRYDCRLRRVEPGEVVVREGDYGNSALLVITGNVRVLIESLTATQLGRQPVLPTGWGQAFKRVLRRSTAAETRTPEQVSIHFQPGAAVSIRAVDDRPALFLQDFEGILREHESVSLGPGELFGEVAAMFRSPRTSTVVAETEAAVVEIRWQGLRLLRRDRRFADSIDQHYRKHWLPVHLREIPLLRDLPKQNMQRVIDATELRSYGRMEWNDRLDTTRKLSPAEQIASEPLVVDEGQSPTELMIVRSGFGRRCIRQEAGEQTVAYLGKGHLFGMTEIVHNAIRAESTPPTGYQNSLRAVGFLDVLAIPVETFAIDVLPYLQASDRPAVDVAYAAGDQLESTVRLDFIVQHRLNNGRDAMVIDLHRCTRCDDCVKACADVHDGNPRFKRQGVAHERLQFVQACMHCTDPVCMIGCPTGAITREKGVGVVLISEPICVGCGICADACPYQNITMAEVVDRKGKAYVDPISGQAVRKATKCDSCSGLSSGPACVSACPHDALVRIDLSESPPLTDWLEKRS